MPIPFSRPRISPGFRQILPLMAAAFFVTACGSDKSQNPTVAPIYSSSSSSVASSTVSLSSTASSAPILATGAELYARQCVGCHGANGEGSTPIGSGRSQTELARFIETAMPKDNPGLCAKDCSEKIAAFIVDNFYPKPFAWQSPTWATATSPQGAALKVTGAWQTIAFEAGKLVLKSQTGWQWLYRFNNDQDGTSHCTEASCLDNWQPIIVSADQSLTSPWGKIERGDDYWQVTFWGNPVYAKKGGGDALLNNPMWPAVTPIPLTFNQGKLTVNGRFNTRTSVGTEWQPLANRALYLRTQNSTCEGNCLTQWPALLVNQGYTPAPPWGSVALGEHQQWTYFGKPVYLYNGDRPGDALGNGIGDWVQVTAIPVTSGQTEAGPALVVNGQAEINQLVAGTWQNQWQARHGHSLYIFANDTAGTSQCTDTCAEKWPPLMASTGAVALGDYALIPRGDQYQWAWKGKPLYLYTADTEAGMAKGHNPAGAWQLAGWVASTASSQSTSSSQPSSGSGSGGYSY